MGDGILTVVKELGVERCEEGGRLDVEDVTGEGGEAGCGGRLGV